MPFITFGTDLQEQNSEEQAFSSLACKPRSLGTVLGCRSYNIEPQRLRRVWKPDLPTPVLIHHKTMMKIECIHQHF